MVIARTLLPNPPFIARSPRVRRNASGFFQVAVSTFTTTDAPTCNHRVVDDAIRAFVAEARAYCLLIEGNDSPNSWAFAQACLAQLLRLYQHALLLPEVQPETTELLDSIEHESWQRIREQVARRLARDYYWTIFEPLENGTPEPVAGSLSDDLADIWRDLNRRSELAPRPGTLSGPGAFRSRHIGGSTRRKQ